MAAYDRSRRLPRESGHDHKLRADKSLLSAPPASKRRSIRGKNNELAKHGQPKRTWPIVVFDESHRLRNPYAQQSLVCAQLAGAASFSIFMSATAGQTPHELSYLGPLLGYAADGPSTTSPTSAS